MHRNSARLIAFISALLFVFSTDVLAEETLELSCNIIFEHYAGIGDISINKDIVLMSHDSKPEEMIKVAEKGDYEFWAAIYSVQQINDQRVINNFRVTVRDKTNNLSVSALSDSVYASGKFPHHARIDLVRYQNDGQEKKGELLFECRHFE
jgi:hypothetical protein